jgi:para-aminobenzoate synthetase/4-amino-4-deoxychorismate lyase
MQGFALLDDRGSTRERPTSRLYTGYVREHRCTDPALLDAMWAGVDADLQRGLQAVLLIDYEWGAKLLRAGHERLRPDDAAALRVLMYAELTTLSSDEVGDWLVDLEVRRASQARSDDAPPQTPGVMNLRPSVDRDAFVQAIDRIHEAIAAGETYQVNYTYRLQGESYGSPVALYQRLRERQPVAYGALIELPEGDACRHVLSCSPELFLRHEAGLLTARPMKGTAGRSTGPEADSETARHLSIDVKNRAENLMIVDLLRNDLGRIAQTGSVQVPELFSVEPYASVFQMTSTIRARLLRGLGFPDVLRASFPCGSITGAPKHRTMQLISELETTPRGLYCGAIGWIDAPRAPMRCGDFCLSVAIRTLTLGPEERGVRPAQLGIGAGIVMDSRAADEYDECRLKARFLTGLEPGFQLFETMFAAGAVQGGATVRHLDAHLDRLERSAGVLAFAFDRAAARDAVLQRARALPPGTAWRLRLTLSHDGRVELSHAPLSALTGGEVRLLIADARLPNANPLAAHKTTLRRAYDEGVRAAERIGAFDSLFFTADGRLVEGGRSSVFIRLDGRWLTPPIDDGALPGVMRARLLADPAWSAQERSLGLVELRRASAIVVCNALRGPLPARLLEPAHSPA